MYIKLFESSLGHSSSRTTGKMNKLFGVVVAALFALQTSYAKKGKENMEQGYRGDTNDNCDCFL